MRMRERSFQIKENEKNFLPSDVIKFFKWLGHITCGNLEPHFQGQGPTRNSRVNGAKTPGGPCPDSPGLFPQSTWLVHSHCPHGPAQSLSNLLTSLQGSFMWLLLKGGGRLGTPTASRGDGRWAPGLPAWGRVQPRSLAVPP